MHKRPINIRDTAYIKQLSKMYMSMYPTYFIQFYCKKNAHAHTQRNKINTVWDCMPCSLIQIYQCFTANYYHHLLSREVSPFLLPINSNNLLAHYMISQPEDLYRHFYRNLKSHIQPTIWFSILFEFNSVNNVLSSWEDILCL